MTLVVFFLPVLLCIVFAVVWIIRRGRFALRLGVAVDILIFGGLGLAVLSIALEFLFAATLPVSGLALLMSIVGFVLSFVSPKVDRGPRAVRPPSAHPFLAPVIWLVVGVVAGLAALITALVPVAGCPPLTSWAGAGYLERDYMSFTAGHDCNGSEAVILAVVIVLGILGLAGVIVGEI
ncbi:MAG: hypothetical protein KKH51_11510 [Actinobacteria bacterium]|nr:hypothetical protein [Actinomycetota bacterium]